MNFHSEAQKKTVTFINEPEIANSRHIPQNNELWLEKYKPKKYDDLLTEEKINRDILTWLKSWDEIVFKVLILL
jgi:chromosome transmission fidelity protein 18